MLKIDTQQVGVSVRPIKHKVDVGTCRKAAARRLEANDIGFCNVKMKVAVCM
ncbi:hypothetical protein RA307_07640 [Xanthobacteraceae bacterium Astr-EGSB]|uniref:elongation factor 1-alpha C-terminal domain-related protein n=1 Tax=Astrobacterium formosum TaxID=3069710 RepID=UPI0027B3C0A2|nr:hypothetical protein [Xanthobacteraceae bacterium Astr-EGSB]